MDFSTNNAFHLVTTWVILASVHPIQQLRDNLIVRFHNENAIEVVGRLAFYERRLNLCWLIYFHFRLINFEFTHVELNRLDSINKLNEDVCCSDSFLIFYLHIFFFSSFAETLDKIMEMNTYREERRYSVPQGPNVHHQLPPGASEDLHAWSIYR